LKSKTKIPLINETCGEVFKDLVGKNKFKDCLRIVQPQFKLEERWTYSELHNKIISFGIGLLDTELRPGKTSIAFMIQNEANGLLGQLALNYSGVETITVPPTDNEDQMTEFLQHTKPYGIFLNTKRRVNKQWLDKYIPELHYWTTDAPLRFINFPSVRLLIHTHTDIINGVIPIRELFLYSPNYDFIAAYSKNIKPSDILSTTKINNQIMKFDHTNILNTASLFGKAFGLTSTDRVALLLPVNSYLGTTLGIWAPILSKSNIVLFNHQMKIEEDIIPNLDSEYCTTIFGTPTTIKNILSFGKSLKTVKKALIAHTDNANLAEGIEAAKNLSIEQIFTFNPLEGVLFDVNGNGTLLPNIEAIIVDANGKAVENGEFGTLKTKGFHLPRVGVTLDQDGFFQTNLIAKIDGTSIIKK